jgi:hypothetical protein
VKLVAVGRPILTSTCYCMSCPEAGRRFEQLAFAPPVLNPTGEQTSFYIERIESNVRWDRSISKSTGSGLIPRPGGSLLHAAIRQYFSTSLRGTG